MRGRPQRYENQAEKQKAYRQRKKQEAAALRNSPDTDSLEYWERILQETHDRHNELIGGNPMARCARGEFEYSWWTKEVDTNHQRWWEAHCKVYRLKQAARA